MAKAKTTLPALAGFDYGTVPAAVAKEARAVAERFRAYEHRTVADAIALGADLARIKDRLGHGAFGPWCEAEFGQSARTAQRLLKLGAFEEKSDTVSYLPLSAAYMIAAPSTPEPVRAEIIGKIEAGEKLEPHAIADMISAGKSAETAARAETARKAKRAKLKPEDRAALDKKEAAARKREAAKTAKIVAEREKIIAERDAALTAVKAMLAAKLTHEERFGLGELLQAAYPHHTPGLTEWLREGA